MLVDLNLFLQSVQAALVNQQYKHAQFLLDFAIKLVESHLYTSSLRFFDVGLGLHPGQKRTTNEDCVLALGGMLPDGQRFVLSIVSDGMGGHENGLEAAHMTTQTILEHVFPFVYVDNSAGIQWELVLAEGIRLANRAIYLRNQSLEQQLAGMQEPVETSQIRRMGATVTAVIVVEQRAYIANVGDSRTYLYAPNAGLTKVTQDHSVVARYLADGIIEDEEEIYTHPERNKVTRSVGTFASVEVDTFINPLKPEAILLLCSDGLWEMMRPREIEKVLACPWATARHMALQFVHLANVNGGSDNIGCSVIQMQQRIDISALATTVLDPISALARLVPPPPSHAS